MNLKNGRNRTERNFVKTNATLFSVKQINKNDDAAKWKISWNHVTSIQNSFVKTIILGKQAVRTSNIFVFTWNQPYNMMLFPFFLANYWKNKNSWKRNFDKKSLNWFDGIFSILLNCCWALESLETNIPSNQFSDFFRKRCFHEIFAKKLISRKYFK